MKKVILFILCLYYTHILQAQWVCQNPLPTGEHLQDLFFIDENTGFVGGYNSLLKTTNGGGTWENIPVNTSRVESIFFADNSTGWIAGYDGKILLTTDCGGSWNILFNDPGIKIHKVTFTSESTGYFTSSAGVFKTTNGGYSWLKIFTQPHAYRFSSIFFINDLQGWLLDEMQGYSWYTTNAGSSWNFVPLPPATGHSTAMPRNIYFVDENNGYIAGQWSTFLKTTNGGRSWAYYSVESGINEPYCEVYFRDSLNGWITKNTYGFTNKVLFRTTNGGSSWSTQDIGIVVGGFARIAFPSPSIGYAAGSLGVIYKSTDGGTSWFSLTRGERDNLSGSFFFNKLLGFAVGWNGLILKTSDGGENWVRKSSGGIDYLDKVYFVSEQIGYIVGNGPILKTTNGGETWNSLPASGYFRCVFFIDENTGWATGFDGLYAMTTNGGSSWRYKNVLPYSTVLSVRFIDKNTGFMMDRPGKIQKSTDGGNTWNSEYFDSSSSGVVMSMTYVDGILYATAGELYRSTDKGTTWEKLGGKGLRDIQFPDNQNGFALSNNMDLYSTTDSGRTWSELRLTGRSVYFATSKVGWIFSDFGLIRKTFSGGILEFHDQVMPTESKSFTLFQNYPNPFNPCTRIKFSIPEGSDVKLHIYDILGKQIAVLVDEYKSSGEYEVYFDGSRIASGAYFYILNIGTYSNAKKMILLK